MRLCRGLVGGARISPDFIPISTRTRKGRVDGQCAVMIVTIVIRRPGIPVCFLHAAESLGSRPTVLASRASQDAKFVATNLPPAV